MKDVTVYEEAFRTNTVIEMLERSGMFRHLSDSRAAAYIKNYMLVLKYVNEHDLWEYCVCVSCSRFVITGVLMNVLRFIHMERDDVISDVEPFIGFVCNYIKGIDSLSEDAFRECARKIIKILKNDSDE